MRHRDDRSTGDRLGDRDLAWQREFFAKPKSRPTALKHRLLSLAFSGWLEATAHSGLPRLVCDGFAGAGKFAPGGPDEDCLGSPLLMLQLAERRGGSLRFLLIEKDEENFSSLRRAVAEMLRCPPGDQMSRGSITVELRLDTFAAAAELPLRGGESESFSFIDPYSYDGIDVPRLRPLARHGDLLLHLATGALITKLESAAGTPARQIRRMDRFFGADGSWQQLRRRLGALRGREARATVADYFSDRLAEELPELRHRQCLPLRAGKAHLIYASIHRRETIPATRLTHPGT